MNKTKQFFYRVGTDRELALQCARALSTFLGKTFEVGHEYSSTVKYYTIIGAMVDGREMELGHAFCAGFIAGAPEE